MFKDENRHYSLRKLSVGLASVLIGISFASGMNSNSVKADTVNGQTAKQTTVANSSDMAKQGSTKVDSSTVVPNNDGKTATKEQQRATIEGQEQAPEAAKEDASAITQDIKQKAAKASETVAKLQSADNSKALADDNKNTVKDSEVIAPKEQPQTVVKQQNTAAKGNVAADKDNSSKAAEKDSIAKNDSLTAKNAVLKATVEAAKQSLKAPVMPHADSNETTLNIKGSKAIAENMLKEDKTEVKENQDWADPAKQGFHKTTAGWTKLQQGKDYNAVAKKSVLTFYDNGHVISGGQTLHETINKSFENDADISVVIDKDDLKEGNRILIGSVAFLYPDNRRINYESRGGSSYQLADSRTNTTIGNISVSLNNNDPDELDYFLDVKSPDKYVKDLSFTISHASGRGFAKNDADWMNYYRLSGTTTDNPFRTKVLTPQSTTYNIEIEPDSNFNMKYSKIVSTTGSNIVQGVTAGWNSQIIGLHDVNSNYTIAPDDQSDHVFKRVFQLKNLTNQSLIPNLIIINPYIAPINLNNALGNTEKTTELPRIKAERKADDLTNTQLLEQTARGHYTWSQQSDGSILICYNLHSNDMTLSTPEIDDRLKNTNWWYIENPTNKQQILNHTEDVYKERGNKLIRFSIHPQITVNNYSNKPYDVLVNNLTPTDANDQPVKVYNSNLKYVPVGTILGLDREAIRNINVKFVDDDQTNPVKDMTLIKTTVTGKDLTFTLSSDSSSDNVIKIPDNVILSDSQPDLTKFNYDPTTKTFHYGVVKDTNPDIVIHVKHKIVKGVSGDDKILDDYPNIKKALNASIRLVVNHNYPDNGKFTDENEYPRQYVESIALKRTADVDLTTDSVISGTVGKWTEASSNNHITFENGLLSPAPATIFVSPSKGYTAYNADTSEKMPSVFTIIDSNKINDLDVLKDGGMFSKSVNIVYKADQQKIQVKFVDDDDPNKAQVGDIITVNGVTDGQADFKDAIAAYNQDHANHYDLATGQTDPSKLTHTFAVGDNAVIQIHLKHGTVVVGPSENVNLSNSIDPQNPNGPRYPKEVAHSNLNKIAQRKVVFKLPLSTKASDYAKRLQATGLTIDANDIDEAANTVTVIEEIAEKRSAIIDAITGEFKGYVDDNDKDANKAQGWVIDPSDTADLRNVEQNGQFANFKNISIPQISGYKAKVDTSKGKTTTLTRNGHMAFTPMMVSFMALAPTTSDISDGNAPAVTVPAPTVTTPADDAHVTIPAAKNEADVPAVSDTSDVTVDVPDAIDDTPVVIFDASDATVPASEVVSWQLEKQSDGYRVFNDYHALDLPQVKDHQLYVVDDSSTKDTVLFGYKGQNAKYVFKVKFLDGHYLLTTYKIKSGKLVKLIDYNFIKSSKMIEVILDWLQLE